MELTPYVDLLRRELAVAADAGGDDARALAERLTAPLESAIRLTLLEALSAATAEITRDLAPGSVHLRLRGRDPDFVVTPARPAPGAPEEPVPAPPAPTFDESGGGGTSRINVRLPDELKARIEEAAGQERLSVNAWLVRAAAAALEPGRNATSGHRATGHGQRFTGWVR
ncbi:toxin-antitoxin system HicB family antitoxin [Polymorphospora sp. NPDC050346]|uniref:toxin-antitoxin system HicB family antitoxin n=1 Tax=Polymorphospora sp. NPDC050346 TaxID=3155780 RepID=UPI0033CA3FF3